MEKKMSTGWVTVISRFDNERGFKTLVLRCVRCNMIVSLRVLQRLEYPWLQRCTCHGKTAQDIANLLPR
jgi:hypothetical protein